MIVNLTIHGLEIDYKKLSEAIVSSLQQVLPKEVATDIKDGNIEVNHPQTLPSATPVATQEPNTDNKNIKQKIKIELIKRGIPAAEIARQMGVTRVAIYLTIKGEIKAYRLRKAIAEAIGMEVFELWPVDDNGHKPEKQTERM